jgi:hypothetical protein
MPSSKSTSQKNAARRLFGDSAPSTAASAPKQTEEEAPVSNVTPTSTPRKRILHQSFLSPEKKSKISETVPFVTPAKTSPQEDTATTEYVPTYIHKKIDYKRKGQGKIDDITQKSFDLVGEHFILPKDLETNRKYGPISGCTFEQHAIRAYSLGMLKAKNPSVVVEICTACATSGHKRDECPKLI